MRIAIKSAEQIRDLPFLAFTPAQVEKIRNDPWREVELRIKDVQALASKLQDETDRYTADQFAAIDNGKDYDSFALQGMTKKERQRARREAEHGRADEDDARGVFGLLGIDVHFTIPHNPNGKSRLERWFGTMHERFDKTLPTYTGCSVDDKPENLNAILRQPHKIPSFEYDVNIAALSS